MTASSSQKFDLKISVSTTQNLTSQQVAKLLTKILDKGLEEIRSVIENGEENEFTQQATSINITSAKSIENPSIIPVRHWNAYGDAHEANNFQSDIDDQRESNGQAFITIGSIDGNLDNMISATAEVNSLPLDKEVDVPCLHVHFGNDAVAFSLFKVSDKIFLRPETDVTIVPEKVEINGSEELCYWVS